jgi:hypothetical protein
VRKWIDLFETDMVSSGSFTVQDSQQSEKLAKSPRGRERLSRLTAKYKQWFNTLADDQVTGIGFSLVENVEVGDEVDISSDEFEAILNRYPSADAAMARRCGNEVLDRAIVRPEEWPCVCGIAIRWWLSRATTSES